MAPSATQGFDLDEVLVELGVFSKYQIRNYFLLSIPILVSSIYTLTYLFTALSPPHRCYIPECENLTTTEIYPYWIRNAIPYNDNILSKCTRFRYQANETDFLSSNDTCPFNDFDRATEIRCEQLYIDTTHTSIAHDFNLFCDERWKLGLPGTIHNVGQFCSMLVTGVISDRFGRRFAITAGIVASAIFGIARSYSVSFLWFLIWEFLDAAFGSGAFISSFVLVTELVIPSKRSLVSVYLWTAFPVGEFLLGLIAWKVADWRHLLRYLYFPGLLFVVYLWIIPESVRWLISKNRFQEAEDILKQAATKSDITLSVMNLTKAEVTETPANSEKELNKIDQHYPLKEALQHPTILIRLVVCSTCWIICVFVNYGISLNSVSISGNGYVNFMVIAMMGLPGNILCYFCVNKFGRRGSLCGGFLVTGLACMMIIFGEAEFSQLKLVGYGVGKCTMTMVFGVLYLFTAELFPTPLRHTLFGTCSMFGRVGSILAPQLSFLADTVWYQLPTVLFGITTLIAASLSLLLPETLNIKLPDTIEESVQIGKKQKNPT